MAHKFLSGLRQLPGLFVAPKFTGRMSSRPKGNVLAMAIFIAVFIFFISIALVAQNRQDILLAFTEDHRVRANLAATAGLNFTLHVMRTNPAWERSLEGESGELDNGGEWKILSVKRLEDDPSLIEVKSQGTSAMVKSVRMRIIEEIKLADNTLEGANCIFASSKNSLYLLDQNLKWTCLGPLPVPGTWLSGSLGPLFAHGGIISTMPDVDDLGQEGYVPLDFTNMSISGLESREGYLPNLKYKSHRTICRLSVNNATITWQPLSLPLVLSQSGLLVESGSLSRKKDMNINSGRYTGPSVSWYVLTGEALFADKNDIYSHAVHYFYKGAKADINGGYNAGNIRDIAPGDFSVTNKAKLFAGPAVLKATVDKDGLVQWNLVQDMLDVSSLDQEPTLQDSEYPDTGSLAVLNNSVYAWSASVKGRILKSSGSEWVVTEQAPMLSKGLFPYKDAVLYHKNYGLNDDVYEVDLSQKTNVIQDLSWYRDPIFGQTVDKVDTVDTNTTNKEKNQDGGSLSSVVLRPEIRVIANLLCNINCQQSFFDDTNSEYYHAGANCAVAAGDDFYTFVKVNTRVKTAQGKDYPSPFNASFISENRNKSIVTLAHYNGKRWQLWPNGFHDFAANELQKDPSKGINIPGSIEYALDGTTSESVILPKHLAAARYEMKDNEILPNRYSILVEMRADK